MATAIRTLAVSVKMNSAAFRKDVDAIDRRFNRFSRNIRNNARTATRSISGLGAAFTGVFAGRAILRSADVMIDLRNKMKSVTETTNDFHFAMREVKRIAKESRAELGAVGTLYQRLIVSTKSLGFELKDISDSVQVVTDTFLLSGTTAQEAANSARQFAQGLASGAIKGDEFRSISENNVVLMNLLAEGFNKTVGELKVFASRGGLTAQRVLPILKDALEKTRSSVGNMAVTLSQGTTLVKNSFTEMVDRINQRYGIINDLAEGLKMVSENMGRLAVIAGAVLAPVLTGLILSAMVKIVAWSFAWTRVFNGLFVAVAKVGTVFAKLGSALKYLTIFLVSNPIALIVMGIAAAFVYLEAKWSAWTIAVTDSRSMLTWYLDWLTQVWKKIGDVVGSIGDWIQGMKDARKEINGLKGRNDSSRANTVGGGIVPDTSGTPLGGDQPESMFAGALGPLQAFMDKAKAIFGGFGGSGGEGFGGFFDGFVQMLKSLGAEAGLSTEALQNLIDTIMGTYDPDAEGSMVEKIKKEYEGLKGVIEQINNAIDSVTDALIGVGTNANSAFGNLVKQFSTVGDVLQAYAQDSQKVAAIQRALIIREMIMNQGRAVMQTWADPSLGFWAKLGATAIVLAQTGAILKTVMSGSASTAGTGAPVDSFVGKGQAHDGIDNIPSTGTYLLEKGERVVDSRLNKDLTDFLAGNGGGMGGMGGEIHLHVNGVSDPDVVVEALDSRRAELESMIRQIQADRLQTF